MGNACVRVNGHAYEDLGVLADGGFATVHRVRRRRRQQRPQRPHADADADASPSVDEPLALKWIRPIADAAHLARVLVEIQVQRRLQHPNSLRLVDADVRRCRRGNAPPPHGRHQPPPQHASGLDYARPALASADDDDDDDASGDTSSELKEALLVFPLHPRGSMQAHLEACHREQHAAFTEADCLRIIQLVIEAVLELHARGYVHRDLKPHNLLLTGDTPATTEAVLMDFGSLAPLPLVVRSAHEARVLFEEAAQLSSAPYRAPELWEAHSTTALRGQLDGRSDVWSLGAVLYAMAFGPYSPFESPSDGVQQLAIFNGTVRFPPGPTADGSARRFGETYSRAFCQLITWMLTPEMEHRPQLGAVLDRVDRLRLGQSRRSSLPRGALSDRAMAVADNDWADFSSAFAAPNADSNDASARTFAETSRGARVDPRSVIASALSPPSSGRRLSTSSGNRSVSRRRLSIQGRQLLAAALQPANDTDQQ